MERASMGESGAGWPASAPGAALLTAASLLLVYPLSVAPVLVLAWLAGLIWETLPTVGVAILKEIPVLVVSGVLYRAISGHTLRSLPRLRGIIGHAWRCVPLYFAGGAALAISLRLWGQEDFGLFGDVFVWMVAVAVGGIFGDAVAAWRAENWNG